MVSASIFPITSAYMIGQRFACFLINVKGKFAGLVAGRATVPGGRPFVWCQYVTVIIHLLSIEKMMFLGSLS
jgi:hypothetical protein